MRVCGSTAMSLWMKCGNAVGKAEMTSFHTLCMAISNPFTLLISMTAHGKLYELKWEKTVESHSVSARTRLALVLPLHLYLALALAHSYSIYKGP